VQTGLTSKSLTKTPDLQCLLFQLGALEVLFGED